MLRAVGGLLAVSLLAVSLLGGVPACKRDQPPPHTCTVRVHAVAPPADPAKTVRAVGKGDTEAAAREAAFAEACPKLAPDLRAHCRDPQRVAAAAVLMWDLKDEKRVYEATLTLRAAPPSASGDGTSPESQEAACQAAREAACQALGAPADCVERGTHRL